MRILDKNNEIILSLEDYKSLIKRIENLENKLHAEDIEKRGRKMFMDKPSKTLGESITELMQDVSEEEWEKLPSDGSKQHDHYIYGSPKRE